MELVVMVACALNLSPNEMRTLRVFGSKGNPLRGGLCSLEAVLDSFMSPTLKM